MNWARRHAEQIAAMADADRLGLFRLVVTAPRGQLSPTELAGPGGDVAAITAHLEAMAEVGVLARIDAAEGRPEFRPTADGLVRFGGAAIGLSDRDTVPARALAGERVIERVTEDLAGRFSSVLSPETVAQFVRDSYLLLASRATVTTYLPVLTARFAAERLTALTEVSDAAGVARDSVLFVCVRNQGRSQIAAAIARAKAGNRVLVRTAGSVPAADLDRRVVAELRRRGLDGLVDFPRPLTDEMVRASGVVVTMGCGDACPLVPGRRYVDWPIQDPVGRSAPEVARIVDEIDDKVTSLLASMVHSRDSRR